MKYYIGIDPSINSTGICIQKFDGDVKIKEDFIILKPADYNKLESKWLNKKEKEAENAIEHFQYCFYEKRDLSIYKDYSHFQEYWKSWNMCTCAKTIYNLIKDWTKDNPEGIYIVIEGISYGSAQRTKSIFDLAGLNYLIRDKFIEKEGYTFIITPPSEIKKFASGNGNCNKDIMINIFTINHPEFKIVPKVDDISDAWFMSNFSKYFIENNIDKGEN